MVVYWLDEMIQDVGTLSNAGFVGTGALAGRVTPAPRGGGTCCGRRPVLVWRIICPAILISSARCPSTASRPGPDGADRRHGRPRSWKAADFCGYSRFLRMKPPHLEHRHARMISVVPAELAVVERTQLAFTTARPRVRLWRRRCSPCV